MHGKRIRRAAIPLFTLIFTCLVIFTFSAGAEDVPMGGGYAVTGQLKNVGYAAELYDAENGLPTSDANCIMAASDGYIWIGGYSGIIKYDGADFERLDPTDGLTSGRVIFEDSKGRIWIGTNDNGVVMISGDEHHHFTYKDGLASSSVRSIAEGGDGNIYIGLASGIAYVGDDLKLKQLDDERINSESVQRLAADSEGLIYGNTRNGEIFCISAEKITSFCDHEQLGIAKITTVFADPEIPGTIWLGTDQDRIYRGAFGDDITKLTEIKTSPAENICYITRACGRIWINSNTVAGYLDEDEHFNALTNIPLNNAIEMMTPDYQGNLWFASTRQGVMKVAATNFRDLNEISGLDAEVVNAVCEFAGNLYIGTDKGLKILDGKYAPVTDELTEFLDGVRIRCITADGDRLWISTYTDGKGLVCYSKKDGIVNYTEKDGLSNDGVRCTKVMSDGRLLVCTNGGLTIMNVGVIEKNYGHEHGIKNTVFLTVEEGADGKIYAGSDGDGIYVIDGDNIRNIGRADGLSSDVILRIKRDDKRNVLWIITSNSVEYMRDGVITEVEGYPYKNNFDLFYGLENDMWILSSYGIYRVDALDLLDGGDLDYEVCTAANGLTSIPTSNGFSTLDENGDLFIAGRSGVSIVNIYHYFEQNNSIKTGIRSFICGEELIKPDADGVYTIKPDPGRIQIKAAILDYTLSDPIVRIFLEGDDDPGITAPHSQLTALEFTGLPYGKYTFHIQILNGNNGTVYEDKTFPIVKQPKFFELIGVRIAVIALLVLAAALIVWRVMTNTIIRRQYEQIRAAKEEAERANSAKSRFLANMSHEIRTPINTIMGMDEMILREDATDVPEEYFNSVSNYAEDIKSASESLLSLVNDLLDMSKIESGKMHLVEQEYDTVELIRSIVSMIRVRSSQKGLTFDLDIDETLPKRLYGDCGKIKQIVLNLLTNAVKYTEKGGFTLKISSERQENDKCALRISVKDTGIGVKPEDMEKLFTAYERLDEEKNSGIQGTGLGLDISRRFAELMEGKLWCESVYGEGSEFILTLVQKVTDSDNIGKFTEHSESRSKGAYVALFAAPEAKVLVTDDNPMNLNVIKGLLKATKVQVTTADSGEQCLELLKEHTFDIVFLDHMMPGMDGLETVAHIREDHPDLPVYALTANITAGGDDFYKSKGFDGYLSKPIDSPTLERTIMKHLPPEIIQTPAQDAAAEEPEELPEDMLWLNDIEGISVTEGIANSGGVSSFLFSLKMFTDTTDDNSKVIEDAYNSGDIRLYTVKVHALKSSARIIGASGLSALAQELENAGNKEDMAFIDANTSKLLADYRAYKDKLSRISADNSEESGKEPIPEDELRDAYSALKDVIPQMDYDSVEMIIEQLKEYSLPAEDAEKISSLEKMLRAFDWDSMEDLINKEN